MENTERFDVVIIGTGPAGISAAITLKIRNKKILLIGSAASSEKLLKANEIQNYPGFPNISGSDLQKKFLSHLDAMQIKITEGKVNAVFSMGDYFGLQTSIGMLESSAIIIATGVSPAKMFTGEKEFLGRGVSYCATCDGALYKNKTVAVVGYRASEENEVAFLSELASKVFYFPMYAGDVEFKNSNANKIEIVREVPSEVRGEKFVRSLCTNKNEYQLDGIFILRSSMQPSQLLSGIAMRDNHIDVNREMQTNIAGCFAAGDVTGLPYQYVKAAGEGNVAALSAVSYLAKINSAK